jgi:hypothetical protein
MDQVHLEQIASLSAKVAKLERTVEFLLEKLNLQYFDDPPPPQFPEVERWLRKGDKIMAIKAYQLDTGAGLSESKAAVEALQRSM